MERITGREAITVMAEVDLGFRELDDDEMAYVWKQAVSFRDWLVSEHKMSLDEAKELCRSLYDKDVELLEEVDPYADHIWSRGQEAGDAEIDITSLADKDFDKQADAEFDAYRQYWAQMEYTAEAHAGKRSPEQWAASTEKLMEIVEHINKLCSRYQNKLLTAKDHAQLAKVNRRIDDLRFGKKPILFFRHWAIAHNLMVNLRGVGKIIRLPVPEDSDDNTTGTMANEDAMNLVICTLEAREACQD